ncbi:MAG: hypothetical protein AAFV07_11170, partial [Bacteroidota bacterium]
MRYLIFFICILSACTGGKQEKDRRAKLEISGGCDEIAISPKGAIWLTTATGEVHFAEHIDSTWHTAAPIFLLDSNDYWRTPRLDRVSFFNSDTAIITGYISHDKSTQNGFFRTEDGGKSWELRKFNGEGRIYEVCTVEGGLAWMGGSSGAIYFTDDYGSSWQRLNSPFDELSRLNTIHMADAEFGVAGALYNQINLTEDNWQSSKKIPTPLDQNKYTPENKRHNNRINKIRIWGDYLVVKQHDIIFYSEMDQIEWKRLPMMAIDFAVDPTTQDLFCISPKFQVYLMESPAVWRPFGSQKLKDRPLDIQAFDHQLFAVFSGKEVCRVEETTFSHQIPYTTDVKISEPTLIKPGREITWGITKDHIYLSDGDSLGWYRENVLDFEVKSFHLLNDHESVLWDGERDNYAYSRKTRELKPYYPEKPLDTFLASPVQGFTIEAISRGCFHYQLNKLTYTAADLSRFELEKWHIRESWIETDTLVEHTVDYGELTQVLGRINTHPEATPSIADFEITEADIASYYQELEELTQKGGYFWNHDNQIKLDFFQAVPGELECLEDSVIRNLIGWEEGITSTSSSSFSIKVINQVGDTLKVTKNFYHYSTPWHLPWIFEMNGAYFQCKNASFSRFIGAC